MGNFWTYWVTFEHYLQINTVKYNANQEIKNIYKNLQKVWLQFFTKYSFIFGLVQKSFGLSVFQFYLFDKWQIGS